VLGDLTPFQRELFRMEEHFRYLPAAGLVPLARPGRSGFSADVFGDVVVRGPVGIDPLRVGGLLDESFHHTPIDLVRGEVVFLYHVMAGDSGAIDHLVFCTSRMPFLGEELVIDAVFPGGSLFVGQQIEIRGRQLGFSDGSARVTFDGRNSDPLAGSSDSRLRVTVPLNLPVDAGGSLVTLEVTGNAGTDEVPVVIGLPEQEPVGLLHVEWRSIQPSTVEVGSPCTVTYGVTSRVTPDVDVELRLDGTQSVIDAARLEDESGNEIVDPVHMDTDDELTVLVVVDAVPDVAEFVLGLGAVVVGQGDIAGADTRTFPTGEPTPAPDPAITIVTPPDVDVQAPTAVLEGTTLRLGDDAVADLEFVLNVRQAGSYEVRVQPSTITPPWLSVLSQPNSGRFPDIPASEFAGDGVATREIRVTVARRSAAVPPPATVTLIVNRPGRSDDARVTYRLEGS
jgi:hypothetical protein